MKKIIIFLVFMTTTTLLAFSLPPIEIGIGSFFMPGQYDYNLITLYTKNKNNDGIENLTSDEIQPTGYIGLNFHASVEMYSFMLKPEITLAIPTKTTIDYIDTSTGTTVPHTIEHKALLVTVCPWIGPVINGKNLGAFYILLGPYLIYAEWRDRVTVGENQSGSYDRQYKGFGVTFPILIGGKTFITKNIGITLEGIVLGQQILIESFNKDDTTASQSTWKILPFPAGTFYTPVTLVLQIGIIYRL